MRMIRGKAKRLVMSVLLPLLCLIVILAEASWRLQHLPIIGGSGHRNIGRRRAVSVRHNSPEG